MRINRYRYLALTLCGWLTAIATPAGAISADHPACDIRSHARPAGCPPIAEIASLPAAIRQSNVFFPSGGAILDAQARKQLAGLAKLLSDPVMADTCIRLVGHTDPSGPADVNQHLSLLRAKVVADFLASEIAATSSGTIETAGNGELSPISTIAKDSVAHRRVTIEARPCPTTTS